MAISPEQKRKYANLLAEGYTMRQAAETAGFSYSSARNINAELNIDPHAIKKAKKLVIPEPKQRWELDPIPLDCLEDFGRFRYRYFGRKSSPWQEHAAQVCVEKLNTPLKEYGVVNCPPGSGKSTLFTHDIPTWLTARQRSLRGFIGSSTQPLANSYTGRLRGTLERTSPPQAKSEEVRLGLAVDAESVLPADYGRFKPIYNPEYSNPPWAKNQFTVEQLGMTSTDEKEATWTAFGMDAGFLGWRVNFIVWDDLVTKATVRTSDAIQNQRRWWLDEAQTRLEPGGLLILQGQRLHGEDLYRFCLDLEAPPDLFDFGEEQTYNGKKYFHIVYKAHYDEHCQESDINMGMHRPTDPAYDPNNPENSGCLLDPMRLSWRELKGIQLQPLSNYRVVYQQEDVDPADVLIPRIHIEGGYDPQSGHEFPGCMDKERRIAEIPVTTPAAIRYSIITADPSPTRFWSIQWWMYTETPEDDPRMGLRYLLDMVREPMGSEDLLDWNISSNAWTGLLEDWWNRSKKLHVPITHLIVEQNAAQRFMLRYDWFRRWMTSRSVQLIPHTTHSNKADPELGISTIAPHYRFGRVRLPQGDAVTRSAIQPLIHELTHYPDVTTDDCVMANWFFEYQLPNIHAVEEDMPSTYNDIPTWMRHDPVRHPLFQHLPDAVSTGGVGLPT